MANELNAKPLPQAKDAAAPAATAGGPVWISQTPGGAPIDQVKQSIFTANNLYWLNFSGGKTNHQLDFEVTFKAGSPLVDQAQHFQFPDGYSGATSTPFGVPVWGGDLILGIGLLSVQADGVPAGTFHFAVVP